MDISISDAEGCLADLVRRVEAGEEIVLTQGGVAAARLIAAPPPSSEADVAAMTAFLKSLAAEAHPFAGPSAARAADFLYDDDGLPA